jgi:acyl carrier protein
MEQFIEELIEVFERDDIDPDDEFRDYEEWDSMAYLSLIAMIDDNYDFVIPGEEFANLNKIIDIYNYINNHHKN